MRSLWPALRRARVAHDSGLDLSAVAMRLRAVLVTLCDRQGARAAATQVLCASYVCQLWLLHGMHVQLQPLCRCSHQPNLSAAPKPCCPLPAQGPGEGLAGGSC